MASIIPGRLAEYRKRLSDPGRRSTIPNAYLQKLDPALFARRQTNTANVKRTEKNDALYDPFKQLSGSQIYSLAKTQAGLQFDPQIAEAQTAAKLTAANDSALMTRLAGYNQMANSALQTAGVQAQTGATNLAAQLANTRTGLMTDLQHGQDQAQGAVQDDTALRGADVTGGMSQRLTQDFLQQKQGIEANLAAQENSGNTQAQGWAGLVGMMQGAQAIRGTETLAQVGAANANREAGAQADVQKLVGAKGAAQVDSINSLRQSEFEKGATVQTLNLKGQAQQLDAQKAASDEAYKAATLKANTAYKQATIRLRALVAQQAHGDRSASLKERIKEASARQKDAAGRLTLAQNREARLAEQAGKADPTKVGGIKLRTPLQQSDFSSKVAHLVNGIVPELKSGRGIPNPNYDPKDKSSKKFIVDPRKGGYSRADIGRLILRDPKSPEQLAVTVALDVAMDGHISPTTIVKLHRAGIAVKNLPYKTRNASQMDHFHDTSRSGGGA